MHGELPTREAKLAALAANQHGVVAHWQLVRLGFGRGAIEHRLHFGRLHRVYRGVYAVGYPARTMEAKEMAAVLACGSGAVLSHWNAAARWDLLRRELGIHVSAPGDRRPHGIQVHHTRLHPSDCTKRDRIPVTTVPRTLLDVAAIADERVLRRAVNQADRQRRLNRNAIQELLERNQRRAGTKALRAVIAAVDPTTHRTRSDLEADFLALCRRYGIEKPVMNARLAGYEVDAHWPGTSVVVEIDSYEYHRTPAEFHADRYKDAQLKLNGFTVLRISDHWLATDPKAVAEAIRYVLTSGSIASSE